MNRQIKMSIIKIIYHPNQDSVECYGGMIYNYAKKNQYKLTQANQEVQAHFTMLMSVDFLLNSTKIHGLK